MSDRPLAWPLGSRDNGDLVDHRIHLSTSPSVNTQQGGGASWKMHSVFLQLPQAPLLPHAPPLHEEGRGCLAGTKRGQWAWPPASYCDCLLPPRSLST